MEYSQLFFVNPTSRVFIHPINHLLDLISFEYRIPPVADHSFFSVSFISKTIAVTATTTNTTNATTIAIIAIGDRLAFFFRFIISFIFSFGGEWQASCEEEGGDGAYHTQVGALFQP